MRALSRWGMGSLVAVACLGGNAAVWAHHGNPEQIRAYKDRINTLQGERPQLRANRDAAVQARRVERQDLKAQGVSKGSRMWKESMAPSRSNVRAAKGALGENKAAIHWNKTQLHKLTTHKSSGGGCGITSPQNCL